MTNQKRDQYIFLIERMNGLFENDLEFVKFKITDFDDYRQVKNAIPLYAKKLMELARYYRKHREYIKSASYRNSLYGTRAYTAHMLYNYFLEIAGTEKTTDVVMRKCLTELNESLTTEDSSFWNPELDDEYYIV
jgi:hypothetical protein